MELSLAEEQPPYFLEIDPIVLRRLQDAVGGEDKDSFWHVVAQCTAGLPQDKPRYLMDTRGVGYPLYIVVCSASGADVYDDVYPKQTGRFTPALVPEGVQKMKQNAMTTDERPIDPSCPCMEQMEESSKSTS